MKNIYVIVTPNRSAVTERLEARYRLKVIQPYTTRPPRYDGETGFNFVSNEEYSRLTDISIYTWYSGYRYAVKAEQLKLCDPEIYVIDSYSIDSIELERVCANYSGEENIKIIYVETDFGTSIQHMLRKYSIAEKNSKYEIENICINVIDNPKDGYRSYYDDAVKQIFDYIVQNEIYCGEIKLLKEANQSEQAKFRAREM